MTRSPTQAGIAALGVVLALGGAPFPVTAAHAAPPAIHSVAFACPGGQTLKLEFATSDSRAPAVVHPPVGPPVTLPSLPTGDGFRYGDASHELRGRGNWVTWTVGSKPPLTCTVALSEP